jgi:hypothetical protein
MGKNPANPLQYVAITYKITVQGLACGRSPVQAENDSLQTTLPEENI